MESSNKYKIAFYRRLVLAYLIEDMQPINITNLAKTLGWSRRTVEVNVLNLDSVGITVTRIGSKRTGGYQLDDWGPIKKTWVSKHYLQMLNAIKL